MKSLIPAGLVVALGAVVGIDGILGISILALLASFYNSNGGLWLAFTGRYGDARDRGAYMASAVNDASPSSPPSGVRSCGQCPTS